MSLVYNDHNIHDSRNMRYKAIMAEQYLKEVLLKTNATKEVKGTVKGIFDKLLQKTLSYVKSKYIDQAHNRKSNNKPKNKNLESSPSATVVRVSQIREENVNEFKQKEEETKGFVKKLKKEQKMREMRLKEREEEERMKLEEELRGRERERQELLLRQEEEKIHRVKELKEKSKKRKEETRDLIELGNQEYKKVISSKPFHEKIEEKYIAKVVMPELERHKLELAKKREMLQPINRSAILEHARRHDQIMEEHDLQKRNVSQEPSYDASKLRTKYTIAYIEDEKKRKHEMGHEALEKKSLVEKKKQYAELVLEMYQPTVDPAKQLELKLIKEKLENSSVQIMKKRSAKSLSAKEGLSDGETNIMKKKWKKNKMVPEPPKKREPVKIDWLADKRKDRETHPLDEVPEQTVWESSMDEALIKSKVKKLENEVRKQEIKLEVANPTNIKGIETTEHVNNMLINSIKGKLAILEKS